MSDDATRRSVLKTGAATTGALALGATGSVAAQQEGTPEGDDQPEYRPAVVQLEEFNAGSVFRVASPALQDAPALDDREAVSDHSVRVIEYFNTNEEASLFVPPGSSVQQGELYVFGDGNAVTTFPEDDDDTPYSELVQVQYRPLGREEFPFDLEEADGFDILEEGGGEAAIRPADFYTGALFEISSGPQGWVPADVADSGFFTDYDTVHAEYLGTNDEFLFFPQEGAEIDAGRLYVMWNEFEFFTPEGNLVATEFDVVNEESIEVDDDFL